MHYRSHLQTLWCVMLRQQGHTFVSFFLMGFNLFLVQVSLLLHINLKYYYREQKRVLKVNFFIDLLTAELHSR